MPDELTGKPKFDQRLREALVELLENAHSLDLVQALAPKEREAVLSHARLLGWQAPIALVTAHEAADLVCRGHAQAFEALVTLTQFCYGNATLPDFCQLHDALRSSVLHPKVNAAVETMAAAAPQARLRDQARDTGRMAFVVSSLIRGSGTTYVIRALIPALAAMGWEMAIYPTLLLDATDEEVAEELRAAGVTIHRPPAASENPLPIAAWIADHLQAHPVDAVVHYVWPNDYVSKLVGNWRCAPVQVFVNHTCDQPTGNFDLKLGYSGDYRGHHQADRYVTMPNCSVRASQARKAQPFSRQQWKLPADALLLATFSRLAKCVDAPFLEAMCSVLRANPSVIWLLVGERDPSSEVQINAHLERAGVQSQVAYTGFMYDMDYFRLLKTVDLYCDTITWMGGQTVADAVVCGLAVVCCAPAASAALAPHANNSTVLASALLAPDSLVAQAGDAQDYARLAQAYIDDADLRARAGQLNAASVQGDAWEAYVRRFDEEIRSAYQRKKAAQSPAAPSGEGRSDIDTLKALFPAAAHAF